MFKTLTSNFMEDPVLEMNVIEPTDEIQLWGKTYRMYKDEWKHHVHLKCYNLCDANCPFCIERVSRHDANEPLTFLKSTEELLQQLHDQKQLYTVSITGGEPTMFPQIDRLIEVANRFPLKLFSMNTNGRFLDKITVPFKGWANISKHNIHDQNVMRRDWEVTPKFLRFMRCKQPQLNIRFQCVLGVEGGLQSIKDITRFMSVFQDVVDDFSFRSLIIENADGEVPELFKKFRKWLFDAGWCVEQTIQDYYVYEVFHPPGHKPITISWSNMGLLQRYNETHNSNFLEEIIVHPDGMITGSWNRKTLVIHDPKCL